MQRKILYIILSIYYFTFDTIYIYNALNKLLYIILDIMLYIYNAMFNIM